MEAKIKDEEQEVLTILKEYTGRLRSTTDDWLKSQRKRVVFFLILLIIVIPASFVFFEYFSDEISLFLTSEKFLYGRITGAILGTLYSLYLIDYFHHARSIWKEEIRTLQYQLEKVLRELSAREEHVETNRLKKISLEFRLLDAEQELRRSEKILIESYADVILNFPKKFIKALSNMITIRRIE